MKTATITLAALLIFFPGVLINAQQPGQRSKAFLEQIRERVKPYSACRLDKALSIYSTYTDRAFRKDQFDYQDTQIYTFQRWLGTDWVNDSSEVRVYNEGGLLDERVIRDWGGSQWLNKLKYSGTYDQSFMITEDKLQYYSGGQWVDSLKNIYIYNSMQMPFADTTLVWVDPVWEYYQLLTITYNYNQIYQEKYQNWNGSAWEPSSMNTYIYSNDSITVTSSVYFFGFWIDMLRIITYYNPNGNLSELRLQYWDFSSWVNLTHILIEYDNNYNISGMLMQDWDASSSSWVNYIKITATYTPGNLPLSDLTEIWSNNAWNNSALRNYSFDGNSLTEIIGQLWNGSWYNDTRETYAYITDVPEEQKSPVEYHISQNYPNPFNPSTTINYSIPEYSRVTIKIFDIAGNEIYTLADEEKPAGTYALTWNAVNLPSGVYFYRLQAGDFIDTRKMILIK